MNRTLKYQCHSVALHRTDLFKPLAFLLQNITVCLKVAFGKDTVDKASAGPEYFVLKNGSNAHDLLKVARHKNPCFNFTVQKTSWGHSIVSLCGVKKNPKLKQYWSIRIAEDAVKPGKSAKYGIDGLKLTDGYCVIFLLKHWR